VQSLLKQDHAGDTSTEDFVALVLWVMSKMMDSTTLGSEKREPHLYCSEFSSLTRFFSGVRYIDGRSRNGEAKVKDLSSHRS
jgi:hypothetical protein